jgi:hypothetical protein
VALVLVLYCESGTCACAVLWQWHLYLCCIVRVTLVHVLYFESGTCTCSVLWEWHLYMCCIVTVTLVLVLYCESGTCTCSVLWQWHLYMCCIMRVALVHVLYCGSGTFTCAVLWQRHLYMFCIVRVALVHILYCDSGTAHVLCCDSFTWGKKCEKSCPRMWGLAVSRDLEKFLRTPLCPVSIQKTISTWRLRQIELSKVSNFLPHYTALRHDSWQSSKQTPLQARSKIQCTINTETVSENCNYRNVYVCSFPKALCTADPKIQLY